MHRFFAPVFIVVAVLILRLGATSAQEPMSCPSLVANALTRVATVCVGTGRNQVCYGNSLMQTEARPEIRDLLLTNPGDIAEINQISRISLSPMNVDLEQWGVAVMRVQANLPDSLPGQNVLFMLFGDVELEPAIAPSELVSVADNISLAQQPVRAFRLHTGVGAPQCDAMPRDGLLIQTPHGAGRVELAINGVEVNLGSTVFFSIQDERYLKVTTLEGSALLNAGGGESIALAGSEVMIPLNDELEPASAPMLPQAYDPAALSALPLASLDRPVEMHEPLSPEQIAYVNDFVLSGSSGSLIGVELPTFTPTPRPPANNQPPQNTSGASTEGGSNNNPPAAQDNGNSSNGNGNSGNGNGNSNNGNGNGGNNPNGNGGNCPGNSCNSNGAAGQGPVAPPQPIPPPPAPPAPPPHGHGHGHGHDDDDDDDDDDD